MSVSSTHALSRLLPDDAPELFFRFGSLWLEARRGRLMPSLPDLDPIDMPWALRSIFVLKRPSPGENFIYHLVGEEMSAAVGGDGVRLKGKSAFDVFPDEYGAYTNGRWEEAARERHASYIHSQHPVSAGHPVNARRIMFPLAKDGKTVDALIGLAHFENVDPSGAGSANAPVANSRTVVSISELL